jgi:hypothetical protein
MIWIDHDNNSFAEQSGWVGKDDGLLVFDKNNNGKIDDKACKIRKVGNNIINFYQISFYGFRQIHIKPNIPR